MFWFLMRTAGLAEIYLLYLSPSIFNCTWLTFTAIVLAKKTKWTVPKTAVKNGNSTAEMVNVSLQLGDVMVMQTVRMARMKKTAPLRVRIPPSRCHIRFFQRKLNAMSGLSNAPMVNVSPTGGNVMGAETVPITAMNSNVNRANPAIHLAPKVMTMTMTKRKTQLGIHKHFVQQTSSYVQDPETVFGKPGYVTLKTTVPEVKTNPKKSANIDPNVAKTCSDVKIPEVVSNMT